MGGYLGPQPVPQAVIHKQRFPLASGQTSVATAGYIPGYVNAWLNGQRLDEYDDFTATNGSDVVLTVGGGADGLDVLIIEALVPFQVLNQYFTGTTKVDTLNVLGPSSFGNEITVVGGKFGANANFGAFIIPKAGGAMGDFTVADPTGNPRLSVDSVGRVTAPFQPAFSAKRLTNITATPFTIVTNYGSQFISGNGRNASFNGTTGRFTAPVPGVYHINVTIRGQDDVGQDGAPGFVVQKNGAAHPAGYDVWSGKAPSYSGSSRPTAHLSTDIELALNDYIEIGFCGNANQFYFSGHLIG